MKDLGTYFLRVEFVDGRGYIEEWETAGRFLPKEPTAHANGFVPLKSWFQQPIYENEQDVINTIISMYTEGNYSCDCNRLNFIGYSHGNKSNDTPCGDTITLKRLTLIRPDNASELIIYESF